MAGLDPAIFFHVADARIKSAHDEAGACATAKRKCLLSFVMAGLDPAIFCSVTMHRYRKPRERNAPARHVSEGLSCR